MGVHVSDEDEPDGRSDAVWEGTSDPLLDGVPLRDADHEGILRMIISEGTEAAMETFFEAKDPNIDPLLKLKLRGMASNLGDNVRKAVATFHTHFGGKG
jgi:hypothetical protein